MTQGPDIHVNVVASLDINYINTVVNKRNTKALVDTGACISCISLHFLKLTYPHLWNKLQPSQYQHVFGVGGEKHKVLGSLEIKLHIQSKPFTAKVHVFDRLHHHFILGRDFLKQHRANIDLGNNCVTFDDQLQVPCLELPDKVGLARLASTVKLPPESVTTVPVNITRINNPRTCILEPDSPCTEEGAVVAKCTVNAYRGKAVCQIMNPSPETVYLKQGKIIARAQTINHDNITEFSHEQVSVNSTSCREANKVATGKTDFNIDLSESNLNDTQKQELQNLIEQNRDVFSFNMSEIGCTNVMKHTMDTGDAPPQRQMYYRTSPQVRNAQEKQIGEMLENNIIEPSSSLWQSPVVMVKKKSGEYRFAVDYRRLNNVTKQISQTMPRLESIFDALGEAQPKYLSTLDMSSGFWQIPLDEASKEKTTFTTQWGNYNFTRMPFGLVNAPASYTILTNKVLQGLHWKNLLCYVDDILVYSKTFDQHLTDLQQVFDRFRTSNLTLSPTKCKFAAKRVLYLGHYITDQGIEINDSKVEVVKNYPRPTKQKHVRQFIGLCQYYRKFLYNFSKIVAPLNNLLKKEFTKFEWLPEHEHAFTTLKEAMCKAPVLKFADNNKDFILTTDASNTAIGYILSQIDETGIEHPVSYGGRGLRGAEVRYNTSELECLALVEGFRANHIYLANSNTLVQTDHSALQWLHKIQPTTGRLARWALLLQSYKYTVKHKAGKQNKAADSLSRREYPPHKTSDNDSVLEEVAILSIDPSIFGDQEPTKPEDKKHITLQVEFEYLETSKTPEYDDSTHKDCFIHLIDGKDIKSAQRECDDFKDIIKYMETREVPEDAKLARAIVAESDQYVIDDGLLYHLHTPRTKGVPKSEKLVKQLALPKTCRQEALEAYHDSLLGGGHFGFDRTYESISKQYYWPKMYNMIMEYVKTCDRCQRAKRDFHAHKAPLKNMPVAAKFERWHIDVLGPVTEAENGEKYILLIVDSFTRWCEAIPLKTQEASEIAKVLYRDIFARYGAPRALVSDRGQNFLSKLVTALCELFNVKRYYTSPYHPQTNSTCERLNSTLEQAIRTYCSEDHKDWPMCLPGILMAFRRSPSTHSTKYSPYNLVFGSDMNLPFDNTMKPKENLPKSTKEYVDQLQHNMKIQDKIATENTQKSQEAAKNQYDKKAKTPKFTVGQKVLLQNRAVKKHHSKKFQQKFVGPFQIIEEGPNYTYRLNNIANGKDIQTLIHANRLKTYKDPQNRDSVGLRSSLVNDTSQIVPQTSDSLSQQSQTQDNSANQWIPAEKILATKTKYQKRFYRIKFEDDSIAPEWVAAHDVSDALKAAYHVKYTQTGKLRKSKRKRKVAFRT
jgi:transposase InsO family protein